MPNPDFPAWFGIGVVLLQRNGTRWFVRDTEMRFSDGPGDTGDYHIHLIPFYANMGIDWNPDSERAIGLEDLLDDYEYTGLCLSPDGTMRDVAVLDSGVELEVEQDEDHSFMDEYTTMVGEVQAGLEDSAETMAVEGFRRDPSLVGQPGYLARVLPEAFRRASAGEAPITGATIRESEDARILRELHELAQRQGPPSAGSLLDPLTDVGMFTPQTGLFAWEGPGAPPQMATVVGPGRLNNSPPQEDPVLARSLMQQALGHLHNPDLEEAREPEEGAPDEPPWDWRARLDPDGFMVPAPVRGDEVAGGEPIVGIGQDWVIESPHEGLWRVFGFEGQTSAGDWLIRRDENNVDGSPLVANVGGRWLIDHGVRQDPPDPRHALNVYDGPRVVLEQIWRINVGRRGNHRVTEEYRVKELRGARVWLRSEDNPDGKTINLALQRLVLEGVLVGDGGPRRTAYDRLLNDELLGDD